MYFGTSILKLLNKIIVVSICSETNIKDFVDKKLITWSKKKMENFIRAKLRIITREQHLRNLWELFCPLEVKAQLYKFLRQGLYIKWCIIDNLHNPDLAPYKIRKECYLLRSCLVDSRRILLFMFEQLFLLMGEVWSMHNADTQCTVEGKEGAKRQRKFFMFKFLLSCHNIWIFLHS